MKAGHDITVRPVVLKDVIRMPPIPSGYVTGRAFRLQRDESDCGLSWSLFSEDLPMPFIKRYDGGAPREWLHSYPDAGAPQDFQFFAAIEKDFTVGLLTWREVDWNNTLWLVDIRVHESYRRSGIGSYLVRELIRVCTKSGHRGIHVETQTSNLPAISFYRKHGFQLAGLNDHLYSNEDVSRNDIALFLFREV